MLNNSKVALCLVITLVACLNIAAEAADSAKKSVTTGPDDAVRKVLFLLQSAVASQNADEATKLFADNATFIDEAGDAISGKEELHQRFEQIFKGGGGPGLGIHPESISFPAANVALAIGEVSRKHDQALAPVSRFAVVMTKQEKGWRINQITETKMRAAQSESRLQDLSWLVGHWKTEGADASAQLHVDWTPSKKFITSKSTIAKAGLPTQTDMEIVGWDPQRNAIVSWHFDNNGGFGSGVWVKSANEDKWIVEVSGVGADGTNTVASNVFTLKSPDEFVWQSTNRTIDGRPVASTEPITVHREK